MINANEARAIVLASDKSVDSFLKEIEPTIRSAAEAGERKIQPYLQGFGKIECSEHKPKPAPHKLVERLIEKLQKLGFVVKWELVQDFAPRWGADEDDEKFGFYGLTISW